MALGVGIVGCGNISGIYFDNLRRFGIPVVGCADLDEERARATAERYGASFGGSVDALLADPGIGFVLNLTVPKAHAEVNRIILEAGKHVYAEKPLGISRAEVLDTMNLASSKGLRVGCAPDTVLGAGVQTARKLVDDGAIGTPLGFNAFMMCRGHESWHPSPEFYYEAGGGPMFDMGPYYLSALITLLGPVKEVSSMARATFPTREITSQPKAGKVIDVETPTHIVAILGFESGAFGQITTSFDVTAHRLPHIEVYGSEGTLSVPDPNGFGGDVSLFRRGGKEWENVPHSHGHADNSRGLGVLDMVQAIAEGREHRASGALAAHVVDIMQASLESAESGRAIQLETRVERPDAMPT